MGSFATLDFFRRYLEKFPANKEWERPRIVIDNNCKMPSRVRALLYGEKVEELNFQLNQSVSNLIKAGWTDVILACNTSHAFLDYIYSKNEYAKTIVHDIIQELYDEIKSKKICSPLYLLASEGTIDCGIYDKYFTDVTLKHSKEDYDFIRSMIEAVKTNNITEAVVNEFVDFVNGLPCENVILGCTELPILYNLCMKRISKNIYDPLETVLNNLYKKFK